MFDKLRKKGAEKKESTKKFFNLVLAKSAPDIKKSLNLREIHLKKRKKSFLIPWLMIL